MELTKVGRIELFLEKGTIDKIVPFNHKNDKKLFKAFLRYKQESFEAIWRPKILEKKYSSHMMRGQKYKKEIAFYIVAKHLNFKFIPSTIERKIGNYVGSLQYYMDDEKITPKQLHEKFSKYNQKLLNNFALVDYICGNIDRSVNNVIYCKGKLMLIDNGLSFYSEQVPKRFLDNKYQITRQFFNHRVGFSDTVINKLKGISDNNDEIQRVLMPYLNKKEFISFLTRVNCVIKQTSLKH